MVGYIEKISLSAVTNSLTTIISVISSIITVPLFMRAVGLEDYGLYLVITSLVGFVSLTDIGITAAVTNKIGYLAAEKKYEEITWLLSGAIWFLLSIVVLFGIFLVILFLVDIISLNLLLGISGNTATLAQNLFFILLFFAAVNVLIGGILNSLFRGMNEMPTYNTLQFIYIILYSASFILFLLSKPSITQIAFFQGGCLSLRVIFLFAFAKRRFYWLKFTKKLVCIRDILPLLSHSLSFFLLSFFNSLISKTDFLVISHIVGVAFAPIYSFADKLFRLPAQAIQVSDASLPSITALHQLHRYNDMVILYGRVLRMHIIFRLTILWFLFVYSQEIITIWVGKEFFYGYLFTGSFLFLYLIYSWVGPHFEFINAMFKQKAELVPMAMNVAINLAISILLGIKIGLLGIIFGTLAGNLFTNVIYLPRLLSRYLPIRPWYELAKILKSFFFPGFLLWVVYYVTNIIFSEAMHILFSASVVGCAYVFLVYLLVFSSEERRFFLFKLQRYSRFFQQKVV